MRCRLPLLVLCLASWGCDPGPVRPGPDGAVSDAGPEGCSAPRGMCGSQCFDLSSDPRHCGGCDVRCSDGAFCAEGRCQVTCAPGLAACGELCVDLMASPTHCGACDMACPGELTCVDGDCGCAGALTQCDDACVDLDSSLEHCGACDNACGPHGWSCDGACDFDATTRFDWVLVRAEIPETDVDGSEWDAGGDPDVYVNVRVGPMMTMAPVDMSTTQFNDTAPRWDEEVVSFTRAETFQTYMRLDVFESDPGDDTLIGACRINLSDESFNGTLRRFTCNPTATTAGWAVIGRFVAP